MSTEDITPTSPWRAIEYLLLFAVIVVVLGVAGYYLSYNITFQNKGEGTTFSNLKNDILMQQSQSAIEQQLRNLDYSPKKILRLGTHRSTSYYADVLQGFQPIQSNGSQEGGFLVHDENGTSYFVTANDQNVILNIMPLRE
jgi:hypothetical protein